MNCPICNNPVSDEARACPKCGHPIKETEYTTHLVHVQERTGHVTGHEEFNRLLNEGWQVVDEHEERDHNADGRFTRVVYRLMR